MGLRDPRQTRKITWKMTYARYFPILKFFPAVVSRRPPVHRLCRREASRLKSRHIVLYREHHECPKSLGGETAPLTGIVVDVSGWRSQNRSIVFLWNFVCFFSTNVIDTTVMRWKKQRNDNNGHETSKILIFMSKWESQEKLRETKRTERKMRK